MIKRLNRLSLLGVAHVLPKSAEEVREVTLREKPEVVAIELCPARYSALKRETERPGLFEAMRAGGLRLFILSALLSFLQRKFARQTGMPAGGEMLAAIRYAEEVGARVELIDRDINVTLRRLLDRMPQREKLRLFGVLLLGPLLGRRVELERLTEDQIVAHLLQELKRVSPIVYEVLIEERDAHMALRIKDLLSSTTGKIACIVGAGHVPGLYEKLSDFCEKTL